MKHPRTTAVAIFGGLIFIGMCAALVMKKIDLQTWTAVTAGVATFMVTLIGILAGDSKKTDK